MRRVNPVIVFTAILLLFMLVLAFCAPRGLAQSPDTRTPISCQYDDHTWDDWQDCPVQVVTATPAPFPTPTIEQGTPEPTATPTNTPTPEPQGCIATVNTPNSVLNVRAQPYGALLGQVDHGDTLRLEARWFDGSLWWYGFYWLPDVIGYSREDFLLRTGDCDTLPDKPPQAALIVGLHPVPGAGREEIVSFETTLMSAGIQSGTKPYHSVEYCLDSLVIGATCVYRVPPDCPNRIGGDDPAQSAYEFMSYRDSIIQTNFAGFADSGRLWIELTNECNYDQYLGWWADWMNAALDYAEAHNWPPLALGSLGPGHGSYAMFSAWKQVLMRNHAAGGLFAMHTYAPREICGGDGSLAPCDPWCACRHRTNYDCVEILGYDIDITITEVAANWGNEQVTSAVLQDYADWVALIRSDEGLHSVYFWLAGYHPTWPLANLSGHLAEFAARIIATWD